MINFLLFIPISKTNVSKIKRRKKRRTTTLIMMIYLLVENLQQYSNQWRKTRKKIL